MTISPRNRFAAVAIVGMCVVISGVRGIMAAPPLDELEEQAFKQAAAALRTSQSALGAYFRRLCARMDKAKAVTAAAHKLARLFYALLTKGQEYVDQGQLYYEERYRQRVIYNLQRKASKLGMSLVPSA